MKTQVYTNGNPYGIAQDIVFSMPCRSKVSSLLEISFLHTYICGVPLLQKLFAFSREMVTMNSSRTLHLMSIFSRELLRYMFIVQIESPVKTSQAFARMIAVILLIVSSVLDVLLLKTT